jgi:DNA-binding HxlR family transcriptional regulator
LKSAGFSVTFPYLFCNARQASGGAGIVQEASAHPETCPVLRTADIISGKWTLLILRDLSAGINRFSALERSLVGISPKTLSERLKALEKSAIVTRKSFAEVPPRVEYTLTDMGWDLIPLIEHMREYGNKWLSDGGTAAIDVPEQFSAGA